MYLLRKQGPNSGSYHLAFFHLRPLSHWLVALQSIYHRLFCSSFFPIIFINILIFISAFNCYRQRYITLYGWNGGSLFLMLFSSLLPVTFSLLQLPCFITDAFAAPTKENNQMSVHRTVIFNTSLLHLTVSLGIRIFRFFLCSCF